MGVLRASEEVQRLGGSSAWRKVVDGCCYMCIGAIFIAEFFSNHGMFTGDYRYTLVEVTLWTIGLGSLIPCCLWLLGQTKDIKTFETFKVDFQQTRYFLLMLLAVCVAFCYFLVTDHIPMVLNQIKETEGKQF